LVAGRRFTADCLSEEKREGTLGLLFLTDLKGYDIVLGKLAATSVNGLYGLFALVPVLAVPLLMGGVANAEFWRTVLVLLDTFLLSLAVGMFASAVSKEMRRTMGANFLLLLGIGAVLPACAGAVAYFTPTHVFLPELLYSCPLYALYLCADFTYKTQPENFWWTVGVIHALTWVLIG